jgi:hypothetical protein
MTSRCLLRITQRMTIATVLVLLTTHVQAATSSQPTPASEQASGPVETTRLTKTAGSAPQVVEPGEQPAARTNPSPVRNTAASAFETSILAGGAPNALVRSEWRGHPWSGSVLGD